MKKWTLIIGFSVLVILSFLAYRFYSYIYLPNVNLEAEHEFIHIATDSELDDLIDSLNAKQILESENSFRWLASKMKYNKPKPGLYRLQKGWNNRELITHLRSGSQEAVRLSFNNQRTIEELCEHISERFEFSSDDLKTACLSEETFTLTGLNEFNIMSLFIPNTYEIFWSISPKSLINRMHSEHKNFWNQDRLLKLEKLGLSKEECYTLASIVQKESNSNQEKPRIAGVYLNRLKKGMLLQADPTVIFAVGDFSIRRVLNKHLKIDSPYNTYKYTGLPPGPIGMPDISSIDAVLNAEDHNFLYFCVKPGDTTEHAFASTLAQHNRNARKYQNWLNSKRIFN